jgi:hypothetical protein
MSRELQDKADRIIKELQDSLIPIKDELELLKRNPGNEKKRGL